MRVFILALSIICVVLYGYALAGYVGYSFGRGRADYVMWGLSLGTFCGVAALYLWKKWMPLYLEELPLDATDATEKSDPQD